VEQRPAVIVAGGAAVTNILKQIAPTTPIVTSGTAVDPVRAGWAESYARPGGNITGLMLTNDDLTAKQIEIFRQMVPTMRHLGVFWSATNAAARETGTGAVVAAGAAGLRATLFPVRRDTLDAVLDETQKNGVDAILVIADPPMDDLRYRLAEAAIRRRLPAAGQLPFYADAGLLMTYSADLSALHRKSAEFVQKILRGTPPGVIPFEAPSKIVLRINARTARSLSLELSPMAISLADDVLD
jgi:putative ABC transport system substrate-binding protein